MAGSRMEKLSNIFKRYQGLMRTGAVLEESRPVWYDVYEAFPPATDPVVVRAKPDREVKAIFYPEDVLRSRFTKRYDDFSATFNFLDKTKSNPTELFIDKYLQNVPKTDEAVDLNHEETFKKVESLIKSENGFELRRRPEAKPKVDFFTKTFANKNPAE